LLIGREDLEDDKIEDGEIKDSEIKENEKDVEIVNYEKFFLNHTDRCAVSIYSANLIIDRAVIEIANTY
jgi:hypothetical protein